METAAQRDGGIQLHSHRLVIASWADDDWIFGRHSECVSATLSEAQRQLHDQGLRYETAKAHEFEHCDKPSPIHKVGHSISGIPSPRHLSKRKTSVSQSLLDPQVTHS